MTEPTTYRCECDAIVHVFATASCAPPTVELPTDFVVFVDMRVTRRFAHEGSGMTDACRAHVLSLRDRIAAADLQAFRDFAGVLEDAV